MNKRSVLVILTSLMLALSLASLSPAHAACLSAATYNGNQTIGASCTVTAAEYADSCSAGNESSPNNATVTVTGGAPVIVTFQAGTTWNVGAFAIGANGSVQVGTGTIGLNKLLWVTDSDADGWSSNINTITVSSTDPGATSRRRCLMAGTTADCNDGAYSLTNTCYSYSQAAYYSQSAYYSYAQSGYYSYSQSGYYSYSQGSYYSLTGYYHIFWPSNN